MSYILDALKKSEQDRAIRESDSTSGAELKAETSAVVSINSAPNTEAPLSSAALNASFVVGFVALLAALLASFIMFWGNGADSQSVLENSLVSESDVSEANVSDSLIREVTTDPISKSFEVIDQPTLMLEQEPLPIEQLPNELASKLSPMTISSHIYSTEANRRSIVVNDQRLVEGDYVFTGVQVKQITHQGMIVVVQGRSFIVNRSRGWGL